VGFYCVDRNNNQENYSCYDFRNGRQWVFHVSPIFETARLPRKPISLPQISSQISARHMDFDSFKSLFMNIFHISPGESIFWSLKSM
jgi:hypothetical protein